MGYIKKLKSNELVGGTDKHTIYPVTSTKAVFEEITNGNESSFKSQKTINKEQQDELDDHEERIQAAEAEDIKSITINGSTKEFRVDDRNNVDLTIYTVDNDPEMPSIASNVEDLRNMVGTSTPVRESSHKTRIETLEGDESVTGSVENKIKTKVDSINSSYQDDNNEYVKYSMTQTSGEVTNFNIDETGLKNAITSLNTSISGDNIIVGPRPTTGLPGKIYRVVNSSNNTYTDYMYSNGSWIQLAIHDTSDDQAQVAYYTCTAAGSGAQATKQFVGNGSLTYTPSSGGHIKILMGEANTATGTIYLQYNTDAINTKKPLYYNGEPVSPDNTWEAGETIAVYYDPSANSNVGAYYASNAQGGGGKAEKIKYNNSQNGLSAENVQGALDEVGDILKEAKGCNDVTNGVVFSNESKWVEISTGDLANSSYMDTTDYIQIPNDVSYIEIMMAVVASMSTLKGLCFYDSSKQNIANTGVAYSLGSGRGGKKVFIKVPESASYLRVGYWKQSVIVSDELPSFSLKLLSKNYDGTLGLNSTNAVSNKVVAETSVGLVGGYIDVSDAIVLTDGTYILYDTGELASNSSFSATDYIKIKNEIGLKLKLKMPIVVAASSRAGVAFYDENKTYIFGVKVNYDEERGVETREIDVPFNARYFRTTYWSGEAKETYPATNVAFTCIISEAQGDSVEGLIPCNVRFAYSGYGINAKTGENAANSYMDATDYVEILPYSQYLKVMVPLALSNAFNGIVFYNESKQYVGGNVMPVATARGAISRIYKIPANAKFFRTYYWNASSIETYELPSFSCNFCYDIPEREEDITPMFRFTTEHAGINPSTGGLVYNDAIKFVFSNYVDISGFEKLVVSQSMDTTDRNSGCAFYDEDYNYISGQAWITTTDIVKVNNVVLDIPVGAKYVRTTFFDNYQIEANNLFPFTALAIGNGQTAENGRTIGELSEFSEKMKPYYTGENPYPKFIPIGDSGFYTAPEVSAAPSSSDTAAEMIAKYDALIVANPGRLTKKDLGVASDGVSHLYAYEIEPILPGLSYRSGEGQYYPLSWDTPSQPTIVVTSGVHGNEKVAVLALYNLIEQMLEDPNDNTDYILNNSRLCIIPVVNPYGYDHQQRFNANNKDINNDYGTWSQAESVIVRDYVASLSNVVGFLDCHTTASKPSIWAAADNETCKNLAFNLYQRLYKKWTIEIPSLLPHLPLMMFYLNCWKGPASNYFYDKGLISLTAETVASVQKNIIDGQGGQDNYDIPAVEFGMDIYGNTLIFMIKAIFAARCEDYGVQTFKIVVHPQSVTLSSASDVTFKAWATGKEIQYAWKKSTNGGSSWTDMNNHSPVLTLPSNQVADGVLVRCRCQDSDGLWLFTNTASITIE